jgi:hypothetical protein
MEAKMDNPKIVWEDIHLALWSDGTISIYNSVMGYERRIATYNAAETRELYEVLRKYYEDDQQAIHPESSASTDAGA